MLTQLQLTIKKVNCIYYRFKASNIKQYQWPSDSDWLFIVSQLNQIIQEKKILLIVPFATSLISDNILVEKKIHQLLQTLIIESHLSYKQYSHDSIVIFTKQ